MKNNLGRAAAIADSFSRAAATYNAAAVLQREVARRLMSHLDSVALEPDCILDLGSGTGLLSCDLAARYPQAHVYGCDIAEGMVRYAIHHAADYAKAGKCPRFICTDAQTLPFETNSVDLILSNLMLQWCTDLPLVFQEMQRVLKPGGLLFFSTLGLNTLHELKSSWAIAQPDTALHTFIDMHDIGDRLCAAKFFDVVMHQEDKVVAYKKVTDLLHDLRAIGARRLSPNEETKEEGRAITGKQRFQRFIEAYEDYRAEDGLLPASYEVVYGHGIASLGSQ